MVAARSIGSTTSRATAPPCCETRRSGRRCSASPCTWHDDAAIVGAPGRPGARGPVPSGRWDGVGLGRAAAVGGIAVTEHRRRLAAVTSAGASYRRTPMEDAAPARAGAPQAPGGPDRVDGRSRGRRAGDGEGELRAADSTSQPERAADGCETGEREEVEPDDRARRWSGTSSWTSALALAVRSVKLHPEQKRTSARAALASCSGASASMAAEAERAERERASWPAPSAAGRARRRTRRRRSRGEDTERAGAGVERVRREQRQDHVEVEADGRRVMTTSRSD